jgi:hypothetical protein
VSFDNSRYTFNPFKDYSSVVMPQGRVQLDADWNEFLAEIARRIQAGTLDTMGRAAYPLTTPDAFYISPGTPYVVNIGLGRMYVDGLLAENHGLPPGLWDPALEELSGVAQPASPAIGPSPAIPFTQQPYLPAAGLGLGGAAKYLPTAGGSYVYYLDVWTRAVTWLQDSEIVDSAVGIDTSGRLQTVWQVRWMSATPQGGGAAITCGTADGDIAYPAQSAGQLTTGVVQNPTSGPCCLTTGSGYTGLENQFYRVQIHQGGALGTATFKWSRENASVATSVTGTTTKGNAAGKQATVLTVTSLGRDQVLNFSNANWIELLDDNSELDGMPDANYPGGGANAFGTPGLLCQIDYVDPTTNEIYLVTPPIKDARFTGSSLAAAVNLRIVRWDQPDTVYSADSTGKQTATTYAQTSGDIQTPSDGTTMLVLENGVVATFNVAGGGNFLAGDYWTFAARTDGTLDPPTLTKAPPRGIHHHYTKLSVVTFDGGGNVTNSPDCRTQWGCGCEGDCGCCTVTVGDNVNSFGTYTSIQEAIFNLPPAGGEVCILPGKYYEYVVLNGSKEVTLRGSGPQTILYPPSARPPGTADQSGNTVQPTAQSGLNAVVTVAGSSHIQLTGFTVEAPAGSACVLLDTLAADSATQFEMAKQKSVQARAEEAARKAKLSYAPGTLRQAEMQVGQMEMQAGQTRQNTGIQQQNNTPGQQIPGNTDTSTSIGTAWQYTNPNATPSNTDVTLTDLILTASNFPAIAAVQAQVLEIRENRIFMQDTAGLWPAVYVSGQEIAVERNWIGLQDSADAPNYASVAAQTDLGGNFTRSTTGPVGNGGIQVGGYSIDVAIVENEIEGGAYNAISLGGYVLMNAGEQATGLQGLFPVSPVTMSGQTPMTTLALPAASGNSQLAADGPLANIGIERNKIGGCGLCGIGPVGYFTSQTPETVSIADLSIVGNTLAGTMQAIPAPLPGALAGNVGYGAISLPDLQGLTVRDNTITDFGSAPGAQVCGIFVLNGEQVEISRNQILETRDWTEINQTPPANGGIQAGIALAMVSPPALNQTTQGWWGSSSQGVTTAGNPPIYQPGLPALRTEQNVVRIPLGYSLSALGYGPFSITGNHFATGGTIPWAGGPPPIALNIFLANLGGSVEFDTPTSFAELWTKVNGAYTAPPLPSVDSAIANSTSGTILFAHNQCQVETRGSGAAAPFSSFIATADQLTYSNNLSWMDGAGAFVPIPGGDPNGQFLAALSDAMLLGATVQVSSNRFQEPMVCVLVSGVTAGLLNVTTDNISTMCLIAVGLFGSAVANNLSYYPKEICQRYGKFLLAEVVLGTVFSGATLPEQLATAAQAATGGADEAGAPPAAADQPATAGAAQVPAVSFQFAPGLTAVDASKMIPKALTEADSTSASRLQLLSQTQQARLARQTRVAATIVAKSGANSAQAVAANAAVSSTNATIARVAMLKQRVTAQAPVVAATGWAMHGAVYNTSSAPVEAHSVYFVDGTNTYQNAYGVAYTKSDGSYQIAYAGVPAGQAAPAAATKLYVQVANASGDPVYTSKTAFTPTTGAATYQAITLPSGEKPLGVLPTVLRPVMLAPIDKSADLAAGDAKPDPADSKG